MGQTLATQGQSVPSSLSRGLWAWQAPALTHPVQLGACYWMDLTRQGSRENRRTEARFLSRMLTI